MKRVMILGNPGSGKSTLAIMLGAATGLPVFHMDQIHHKPGWVARPKEEKIKMAQEVERGDRWIFEGGVSTTYGNRAARADTAIWLDLPLSLRFWRVLKRRWEYRGGQTRPDLPADCPEKIDWEFLHWIFTMGRVSDRKVEAALSGAPHLDVYRLRSRKDVSTFIGQFAS